MLWVFVAIVCVAGNCYQVSGGTLQRSEKLCMEYAVTQFKEIQEKMQLPVEAKYYCYIVDQKEVEKE